MNLYKNLASLFISALLCVLISAASIVGAQVTTTTVVTSSLNPSSAGDSVTLSARVSPNSAYDIRYGIGFGLNPNKDLFVRFDLTDAKFVSSIASTSLINFTNPASIANVTKVQGGEPDDRYVIFQILGGTPGTLASDVLQFIMQPVDALGSATVTYSLHDTAASVNGPIPFNNALLVRLGPTSLQSFASPNIPTGTVEFFQDGVTIASCSAATMAAGVATCGVTYPLAGIRGVTANYSGDGNNFPSSGSLLGGQMVVPTLSPATLVDGGFAVPYPSVSFTSTGGVGAVSYSVSSGSLPPGMTLSANGALSGTPSILGLFTFSVTVTDANGTSFSRSYQLNIDKAFQTITLNTPANARLRTSLVLTGSASSGLVISYSTLTPSICTLTGVTLQFVQVGDCNIVATQNGNSSFLPAANVVRTILVTSTDGPQPLRLRSVSGQSLKADLVNGAFQFSAVSDPGINTRLLGLTDFNGNGSPDLIYQDISQGEFGDVRFWPEFSSSSDTLIRTVRRNWDVQATGDLDGDNIGDLVWRLTGATPNPNDVGVSYIWFSNGGSGPPVVRKRGGAPLDWKIIGAADINDDRAADIVYVSPDRDVRVLMATPARTCANLSAGRLINSFEPIAFGDFTGNGGGDIIYRGPSGTVVVVSLDATGLVLPASTANPNDPNASCTASTLVVSQIGKLSITTDPTWRYLAGIDLNGDGIKDIIWLTQSNALVVWLMKKNGGIPSVLGGVGSLPAGFLPYPLQ